MKRSKLQYLVYLLALTFMGISCDNSSSGSEENGNPAVVEGRVDNISSTSDNSDTTQAKFKQVEGAVVKAARVNAEGGLETIGEDSAQTNAEGEFTLEINAQAIDDASERIVITAENEGERAKSYVTSPVERGGTARIQPINYESTSEATVYQQLIVQGNDDVVTNADIEAVVNNAVALEIERDSSLSSEVASALVAKEQAKDEFYESQGIDMSQDQADEIDEIKVDAQIELENRLSTTNEQGVDDAVNAFLETYANAYTEAGMDPTAAAKSSEVASRVLVNQLSALSDTAQTAVRTDAAYIKSYSLAEGVREQLSDLDVSQSSLDNIEEASETLRSDLRALEGDAAEEDVRELFGNFQDVVISAIEDENNLNGELLVAVNASINDSGGAKSTLESALEGNADVLSVMDAYSRYYSDIESNVQATFDDAVEAGVAAYYTQLLILINAPS